MNALCRVEFRDGSVIGRILGQWVVGGASKERRIGADGCAYTKGWFLDHYDRLDEWDAAQVAGPDCARGN